MAKKGSSRKSARPLSLAAFFRRLWATPGLLDRFSQSREGREEVLGRFKLSARHKRLLAEGCVRDIIAELAGVSLTKAQQTTIINCEDGGADVKCGHPECKAFMQSMASTYKPKKR